MYTYRAKSIPGCLFVAWSLEPDKSNNQRSEQMQAELDFWKVSMFLTQKITLDECFVLHYEPGLPCRLRIDV